MIGAVLDTTFESCESVETPLVMVERNGGLDDLQSFLISRLVGYTGPGHDR